MQNLPDEELMSYDCAKFCPICKKVFRKKKNQIKVRDHDHYAGKYWVASHLRYSTQIDIPVFFHNGTNYDFNLTINELAKRVWKWNEMYTTKH